MISVLFELLCASCRLRSVNVTCVIVMLVLAVIFTVQYVTFTNK